MNASVKLLESVLPATAALNVTVRPDHPSVPILGQARQGSGAIIDSSGLILTVNYVVIGAAAISVTLLDGDVLPARVVAQDPRSGLAVVAVDSSGMPTLPLVTSESLGLGQEMFIVAATDGSGRRISNGGITSLAPFDAYWEYSIERAVVSSAVNPGLGGGPMIDRRGRVIGVTALDLNEIGRFTMAIPADDFLAHRDELLKFGRRLTPARRAWIGFYCYTLREHVVIAGVLPGSPGERAGIKSGDVVLAINGQPVSERKQLYAHLWSKCCGDAIEFRLFRDNAITALVVPAGDAEEFFA